MIKRLHVRVRKLKRIQKSPKTRENQQRATRKDLKEIRTNRSTSLGTSVRSHGYNEAHSPETQTKRNVNERIVRQILSLIPSLDSTPLNRLLGLYNQGYSLPYIARYKKNLIGDIGETSLRLIDQNLESIKYLETDRLKAITQVQEEVDVEMVSATIVQQLELASTKQEIREIVKSVIQPQESSKARILNIALANTDALNSSHQILSCLSNHCSHMSSVPQNLKNDTSLVIGSKLFNDSDIINLVRVISDRQHKSDLEDIKSHTWMAMKREGKCTGSFFTFSNPQISELLTAIHKAVVPLTSDTQTISGPVVISSDGCLKFFLTAANRALLNDIVPIIKSEWLRSVTRRAESEAIEYFRKNLRQKLLQPPPPFIQSNTVIIGIDPGLASACKAVVMVNEVVIKNFKFNPLNSRVSVESFHHQVGDFVLASSHQVLVALGNGTGSVECRQFIASVFPNMPVAIVDESGASYYSVSELAMKELPNLSIEYRGAVCIAKRLVDPLSEYVKIEPRRLSVGMYQHDIKEKKLEKILHDIVCECIGDVGVDLKTASEPLLRFVPGLNRKTAKAIVEYREAHGIQNRKDLRKVFGIGPITYEQSVGFLQVKDSNWTPLDSTAVHPDDYEIATHVVGMHPELGQYCSGNVHASNAIQISSEDEDRILQLLRLSDPRELYDPVEIRAAKDWVGSLERIEVTPGAVLTGLVRNVTSFGAFVQLVGSNTKDDGLLHISNYPVGVRDPHYYTINQSIQVKILSVESAPAGDPKPGRVRISLSSRV